MPAGPRARTSHLPPEVRAFPQTRCGQTLIWRPLLGRGAPADRRLPLGSGPRPEELVDRRSTSTMGGQRTGPLAVGPLDAADEIGDHVHLIHVIVSNFHAGELVFDRNHQFHAVEPVGPEIVGKMCLVGNAFDLDAQMLGNERADLPRRKAVPRGSFVRSQTCFRCSSFAPNYLAVPPISGHATASRPDPTKKRVPIKKSGLLQQPHTELAYASRLAARPVALISAAFVRKRHSIDITSHGDHARRLIARGPAAWLDRRDRHGP